MSAQVDQFCDKLHDRLEGIEGRIKSAKSHVLALSELGEDAVRRKLDQTRNDLQARRLRVEQTAANLKARAQQKVVETREQVSEWKTNRDVRKLNDRADRAEAYAADAIEFAAATFDEAEAAIFDAVVARLDADAAP